MRFSVLAATLLAVSAQTVAQSSQDFDHLLSIVEDLRAEATALALLYSDKDSELTALRVSCDGGAGGVGQPSATPPAPAPTTPTDGDDDDDDFVEATPEPTETVSSSGDDAETQAAVTSDDETTDTTEPVSPVSPSAGGGWNPTVGDTWQYNLNPPANTNVDARVFAIDMDGQQDTIDTLHSKGKHVVCYISIGTVEDWRDDANEFPSRAIGGGVAGWAGEQWLDVKDPTVRELMTARVEKAASMNCDAIEPDNMMAYSEGNIGVDVSEADQIDYNIWFAGVVHDHGMKVGLKNCVELAPVLNEYFDFVINEECFQWNECEAYEDTFIAKGKPVFNVEYRPNMDQCGLASRLKIDSIVKHLDLDSPLCSCSDSSRNLDCDSII